MGVRSSNAVVPREESALPLQMNESRQTLDKDEVLRGRPLYDRLLREGLRVRGDGVTLFFYLLPSG